MNLIEHADRDVLALDVANRIAGALENALLTGQNASLAVPGGTTPGPIFDALCGAVLAWDRVTVMLTDERWVSEDHPQSNAALVRQRLLQGCASVANFLPFFDAERPIEAAAEKLSEDVASQLPLTVVVLGMGADMHTASMFPGAEGTEAALETSANAVLPIAIESQDVRRITLSAAALNSAMSKHLVIFGDEKRKALELAQGLPPEAAPVAAILNETTVHWAP